MPSASVGRALLLAATLAVRIDAKACQGTDLPADGNLRIGKKYAPEGCAKQQSKKGDEVRIGYTASLYNNCTQVDEAYHEGFTFTLGDGSMIKGLDQGLSGMCVFEKRKLTVPANLAYGEDGSRHPLVPPGATLVFEIELLGLNGKAPKKQKGRQAGWPKRPVAPKVSR